MRGGGVLENARHAGGPLKTRASLVAGYTSTYRKVEIVAFFSFLVLAVFTATRVFAWVLESPVAGVGLFGLAALTADLFSGLVHWTFDTWGSTDLPVLGNSVLRGFREHHVDPQSITRHDLIQVTGGTNILGCALLLGALSARPSAQSFLFFLALCVAFTNISHMWAHRDANPRLVRALQRSGLALSPALHERHHRAPYLSHYCITFGWLNSPLDRLNFWRRAERFLEGLTGNAPRADDQAYLGPPG